MVITIKRTNSNDDNFQLLVKALDLELKLRDGDDHLFYAQLNKTNTIQHVIVAYDRQQAVGCGAIRPYSSEIMEVKRMFVQLPSRGQGIASAVLKALEAWCRELGYQKCILETGKNQPEAIALYLKNNYNLIPNYGHYQNADNSVCFEKTLDV